MARTPRRGNQSRMSAIDEPAQLAASGFKKRVLHDIALLTMRGAGTVAKFLLAIYTARYLGLRFDGSEDRDAPVSWVPTVATLALTVALAYYAIAALSDAGVRPFS